MQMKDGSENGGVRTHMSATELKEQLFNHFRETGTFDSMRTQLRNKLVSELFKVASPVKQIDGTGEKSSPHKNTLLPLQVSNWLVYDHLKRSGFEYSLSTFVSEANLSYPDKLLSISDILNLIGLDDSCAEHELVSSSYAKTTDVSFLYLFMKSLSRYNCPNKESYQTMLKNRNSNISPREESEISSLHAKHPSLVFGKIFNKALPSLKEDMFDNTKSNLWQQQLQLEREKHKQEIAELRQKLIQELDTIHAQEYRVSLEMEQRNNKFILEKELLDMEKEKIKMKELELKMRTESLDQEVTAKLESMQENIFPSTPRKEFGIWEVKLMEQQQWLEDEIAKIKAQNQEMDSLKLKCYHLEKAHKTLQDDYTVLINKNDELQHQIKSMSDYSLIKEELLQRSKKLVNCEKEILRLKTEMEAEKLASLDTITKLQQKLMQNIPQVYRTQSDRVARDVRQHLLSNSEERQEHETADVTKFCQVVLQRIQEQRSDIQELHRLIQNLYYHNQNDVYPEAKRDIFSQKSKSVPVTNKTTMQQSNVDHQRYNSSNDTGKLPQNLDMNEKYKEIPLKFIADAKKKIDSLDRESKALEEKYFLYLTSKPSLLPNAHIPLNPDIYSVDKSIGNYEDFWWNTQSLAGQFASDFATTERLVNNSAFLPVPDFQNFSSSELQKLANFSFPESPTPGIYNSVPRDAPNTLFLGGDLRSAYTGPITSCYNHISVINDSSKENMPVAQQLLISEQRLKTSDKSGLFVSNKQTTAGQRTKPSDVVQAPLEINPILMQDQREKVNDVVSTTNVTSLKDPFKKCASTIVAEKNDLCHEQAELLNQIFPISNSTNVTSLKDPFKKCASAIVAEKNDLCHEQAELLNQIFPISITGDASKTDVSTNRKDKGNDFVINEQPNGENVLTFVNTEQADHPTVNFKNVQSCTNLNGKSELNGTYISDHQTSANVDRIYPKNNVASMNSNEKTESIAPSVSVDQTLSDVSCKMHSEDSLNLDDRTKLEDCSLNSQHHSKDTNSIATEELNENNSAHSSPFRRRRRFLLTRQEGHLTVDLNAAWKERTETTRITTKTMPIIDPMDTKENKHDSEKLKSNSEMVSIADKKFASNLKDTSTVQENIDISSTTDTLQQSNNGRHIFLPATLLEHSIEDVNENMANRGTTTVLSEEMGKSEQRTEKDIHGCEESSLNFKSDEVLKETIPEKDQNRAVSEYEVSSGSKQEEDELHKSESLDALQSEHDPTASELSELHVSAGSEIENAKDDDNDNFW